MSRRWQYLTIELKTRMMGGLDPAAVQAELTRHGQLGWELVNIICHVPRAPVLLVFKKES